MLRAVEQRGGDFVSLVQGLKPMELALLLHPRDMGTEQPVGVALHVRDERQTVWSVLSHLLGLGQQVIRLIFYLRLALLYLPCSTIDNALEMLHGAAFLVFSHRILC